MRFFLAAVLLFCAFAAGHGALIRDQPMDDWVRMSDIVVYCQEDSLEFKEILHKVEQGNTMDWKELQTIASSTVLVSYKGNLVPGQQITVRYSGTFMRLFGADFHSNVENRDFWRALRRVLDFFPLFIMLAMARIGYSTCLAWKYGNDTSLRKGIKRLCVWGCVGWLVYAGINVVLPPVGSPGRCMLFLDNGERPSEYRVNTAKLVINDVVYEYSQVMNPGPLALRRKLPEFVEIGTFQHYGERELMMDLSIAVKRANIIRKSASEGDGT